MYRIDFANIKEAAGILYRFMTSSALTNPECTIWSADGFTNTIENNGAGFMTEPEFRRKLICSGFVAVTCIASTDKSDTRRVVLNLLPDAEFILLNFPNANGKPNDAEKRLLQLLGI